MVRARRGIVIVSALLVAAVGATYVFLKAPLYEASANVLVESIVNPAFSPIGGSTATAIQPDLNTEAQVVRSTDLATAVANAHNLGTSTQQLLQLLKGVRVSVVRDTSVMQIGYVSPNPATAANLANWFATAYVSQRRAQVQQTANSVIQPLKDQIDRQTHVYAKLEQQIFRTTDPLTRGQLVAQASQVDQTIRSLTDQVVQTEATASSSEGGKIVQSAVTPSSPVGPNLKLAIALGLFLGGFIGSGIAVARGLWTDRIGGHEELSERIGAPVMGVVPRVETWVKRSNAELVTRDDPGSAAAEAYRLLATNIRFVHSHRPQQLIVVTSALPVEGKSATASNLAVVLAEAGLRTLLVDADLRRPRADLFLGVPHGTGLNEALEGTLDLVDLVFETRVPGLSILRSGEVPEDPAALLASPGSERIFSELRRFAEIVICDAPPVLPVADASILAERADSVLFVHDPSISSRTALDEAVRQLHTAGGSILGGVYNNITAKQRSYMGYYPYDYSYYGPSERGRVAGASGSTPRAPDVPRPIELPAKLRPEADTVEEPSTDVRSGG